MGCSRVVGVWAQKANTLLRRLSEKSPPPPSPAPHADTTHPTVSESSAAEKDLFVCIGQLRDKVIGEHEKKDSRPGLGRLK